MEIPIRSSYRPSGGLLLWLYTLWVYTLHSVVIAARTSHLGHISFAVLLVEFGHPNSSINDGFINKKLRSTYRTAITVFFWGRAEWFLPRYSWWQRHLWPLFRIFHTYLSLSPQAHHK
jgi:hypothetical protein